MLAAGHFDVWSFCWQDLDHKFDVGSAPPPVEFAVPNRHSASAQLKNMGLLAHAEIVNADAFSAFERELISEKELPWHYLARGVVASRVKPASPVDIDKWRSFVAEVAPECERQWLLAKNPRLFFGDWRESSEHFRWAAAHDGRELFVLACLDDDPELLEARDYQLSWRGVLRFFQLLRQLGYLRVVTPSIRSNRAWADIASAQRPDESANVNGWIDRAEIDHTYLDLADQLIELGVYDPVVGYDIPDCRGDTWAEVELAWERQKVAVTTADVAAQCRFGHDADWQVFFLKI